MKNTTAISNPVLTTDLLFVFCRFITVVGRIVGDGLKILDLANILPSKSGREYQDGDADSDTEVHHAVDTFSVGREHSS